jgi:small subunit ribosomal protein S16
MRDDSKKMLTIRLQRTGKRNQADFRIVLAEKEAPVQKKHQEVLGSYNPRKKDFKVNEERVKYWISQRVQLSPTVHNLFVTKGLVEGAKVKAFNTPKKPSSAEATEGKPVEAPVVTASAEAPAPQAETQTPTEAAPTAEQAQAEESKA